MQRTMANMAFALGLGVGLIWACLWILVGGASVALAQGPDGYDVYYVAPSCVGAPVPCYTSVQDAVDAVDDPGDVVKVAAGTYTGVDVRPQNDITSIGLVTQMVYISKSVTIRGGYTPAFAEPPDPEANPTTLDAQAQGRVLYITGDISATIEGLTITRGDNTGLGGGFWPWMDAGGGIYIISATANIRNNSVCKSTTAWDGGGVYMSYGAAVIQNNVITANTASRYGGGLLLYQSDVTLTDNVVAKNDAHANGGGAMILHTTATLQNNLISENNANQFGGGLVVAERRPTLLTGNVISGNTAGTFGGGIAIQDGQITSTKNIVADNVATLRGGGLDAWHSDGALIGDSVISNVTSGDGGGLYLSDSNLTLVNDLVLDNRATERGSGLYVEGSSLKVLHNTIARHNHGDGFGLYVTHGYSHSHPHGHDVIGSRLYLTNTILVSHTVGISVTAGNTAILEATLWANEADWGGAGTILVGAHNYWGDPAFVDPDVGDYHIGAGSAAIDVGVDAGVSDDIDGDPRPVGGGYDIGADERHEPEALWVYLPLVLKQ